MQRKKVAIIGAGITGLSLGSYLQRNGYATELFEMSSMVGGVSVGWRRKGYVFDGATNWLPGSHPPLNLNKVIRDVVDYDSLELIDFDEFTRIEHPSGETFTVYKDVEKLHREMLRIAPEDAGPIRQFITARGQGRDLRLPLYKANELYGPLDYLRIAWKHWRLPLFALRWRGMTIDQFAKRFRNPVLRDMFLQIFPRHGFFSALGLVLAMGWNCMKCAGYPIGGSNRLAEAVAQRYRSLGGRIQFGTKVDKILVENGRATGLRLANGERVDADIVVSTGDGYDTLFRMLDGRYLSRRIEERYRTGTPLYPSMLQISLGLRRTFEGEPNKILMYLDQPIVMGDDNGVTQMLVRICSFDPTFAPHGHTAVVVNLRCHDYAYWTLLREQDREAYVREKQRVADRVIDALDTRFGDIRSSLEVQDVATPATYIRYTNIWQGSYQGWAPTPKLVGKTLEKTLPGLRGFYMAGQWVEPAGGLPRAMLSARNVAQIICRDDGRRFTTEIPTRSVTN